MKFIHTGDWHIGKLVHQIHMTGDQQYILERFVELLREEQPDAVVIAGDIYDRSVPPVEAVELLDEVLTKILIELEVPVLAVAGNHDSPDRIGFVNKILKNRGLYIAGRFTGKIEPVIINDQHGPVNFYLVPYADPAVVRDILDEAEIHNHDDAMRMIVERIKENLNPAERNVFVGHAFVIGSEEPERCESERPLSIGGTEYVDAGYFGIFHYTALGHLHRPQKVGSEKIRYAGSLLKYSFSEAEQNKYVTIVEMDAQGNIKVRKRSLAPARDLRKLQGKLDDLLNPAFYEKTNVEDYLMVVLEDEGEILDSIGKLRIVYPNVLRVDRMSFCRPDSQKISAGRDYNKKTKLELFADFYTGVTGKEFTDEKKEIMLEVIKEVEKEGKGGE